MQKLQTLIDRAEEVCGSKTAVAARIGVSRQQLHNLYTGHTPMSVEHAGQLALIAGVDVENAVMVAAASQLRRTERGRAVMEAIERRFLAIVVGICSFFATGGEALGSPNGEQKRQVAIDVSHIVSNVFRTLVGAVLAWTKRPRPCCVPA